MARATTTITVEEAVSELRGVRVVRGVQVGSVEGAQAGEVIGPLRNRG